MNHFQHMCGKDFYGLDNRNTRGCQFLALGGRQPARGCLVDGLAYLFAGQMGQLIVLHEGQKRAWP